MQELFLTIFGSPRIPVLAHIIAGTRMRNAIFREPKAMANKKNQNSKKKSQSMSGKKGGSMESSSLGSQQSSKKKKK